MKKPVHPLQPLITDENGTVRFKENKIVRFLLDANGVDKKIDMNLLACIDFPAEDREQFAQLIGYSLCGFGELSYVRDKTWKAAVKQEPYIKQKSKSKK